MFAWSMPCLVWSMECRTWHALPDRKTAINWVIDNQLSRRNLDPFEASVLRGKKYLLEKKEIGRPKEQLCKNCTISTKDKISQETGVSPRTIIYDIKNEKMCMLLRLSIYLVSTLKLHILAKISSL